MEREVVTLRLRVAETTIETRAELPTAPISVANLVPFLQAVEDAVVETVTGGVSAAGKPVSCRAGCGASCPQLVPNSLAQAHIHAHQVAAMPPERRVVIEARFARALETLEGQGILEPLRSLNQGQDAEAGHAFGVRYFLTGVACPFLEAESCGIHPHRPLACREYLVTSPAAHCATPETETVERVVVPRDLSRALYRLGDGSGATPVRWLPLVLALEWVAARGPLPTRPARQLVDGFFAEVQGSGGPGAEAPGDG
jgi:Fe-S-cluster containining protein